MTLRIGLVGCGDWGRLILRDLLSLGAEVHVFAPSPATRERALASGAAGAVERLDALDGALDGYIVASPSATHAAATEALLPRGRPIFVEKPLTTDVASARRLVAAAPERIFVMDKWRYHGGIEALAAMARAGEFGTILAIRSYRLGWGHSHSDADAAWHLLPHDLAITLAILGHLPRPRSASTAVPGADLIGVLADGGPQVTIEVSASHPVNRRSVVVVGGRRCAQLGGSYDDRLMIADVGAKAPYERSVSGEMPLLKELRAFLEHLRGGPPPLSSAADGLLIVERIAALRALAGLAG